MQSTEGMTMFGSWLKPVAQASRRACRCLSSLAWALLAIVLIASSPANAQVEYFYDEAGRLVGVVAPSGEAAQYVYDAAGNIVEIKRFAAGALAVIEFSPNRGPVGMVVTIQGNGFSSTPANNIVKFNGVTATVTSATATKLVVTVPSGATTGRITVTVGANTATSHADFVIGSNTGAPTISSFSPGIANVGTAIVVTGTNFEPLAANNVLRINGTFTPVTSNTATTLNASIPTAATSGKLTVATPRGTATSSADLYIPPPPHLAADISGTGRVVINGAARSISITQAGKKGLAIFDAVAGQNLGIGMTGLTQSAGTYSYTRVYRPDGTEHAAFYCYTTGIYCTVNLPNLPATGTYSLVVQPQSGATASFSLIASTDLTGALTPNTAFNVNVTRFGQNARLTFAGTAGEVAALEFSNLTTSPGVFGVVGILYKPDGTHLTSLNIGVGTTVVVALPVTGTYLFTLEASEWPQPGGTFSLKVTKETGTTLTVGGAAVSGTIATTGETARFNFSGTAGQNLGIGMTNLALSGGTYAYNRVFKPDGTQLDAFYCYTNGNDCAANLVNLAATGSYTLIVQPQSAATGSFTVHASTDVSGTLTLNTPATINIGRNGQNARFTFSGTSGDLRQLTVTAVSTNPTGQWVGYSFYKPDGTYFTNIGGGGVLTYAIPALPSTGTYTLFIEPGGQEAATVNVTLTLAPR